MLRIAVLGGGVSKKVADLFDRKAARLVLYAPKISLASLACKRSEGAPPAKLGECPDGFVKQIVERDVNKTFFDELEESQADLVLVDFADEIFDFWCHGEGTYALTLSNYLKKCVLERAGSVADWHNVGRNVDRAWYLWEQGCKNFAHEVSVLGAKVVLLRAFHAQAYREDGEVKKYTGKNAHRVSETNKTLERCYDFFEKMVACESISIPEDRHLSQTPEKDGFSPLDFGEAVYYEMNRAISSSMGSNVSSAPVGMRVDNLLDFFAPLLDAGDIPSIQEIYHEGQKHLQAGNRQKAIWCERLIGLLHNSSVPLSVQMGKVTFGYGGIGVIIHGACKLGNDVIIGSNVTLGGGGKKQLDAQGVLRLVPEIEDRVYIATGAKLIGGILVGHHSVIGANSVVTEDVPPFSVVAGNPAKVVKQITKENFKKYASYLYRGYSGENTGELIHALFGAA